MHSFAFARICLPFCSAILFCHSVLPFCSAGCASVACLNAYLPLSECLHCCSSIWLPFCLSAGISAQMSVLAAGYLPVWLLVCLSGGLLDRLSIHLAASGSGSGRISICLAICLLVGLFWRLFILLLILVPILLVCQFGHLQVCSVACRLQFRPFACSTGQVPIRLFICQSWQAMSQFWQSVCSFSCNWQHLAAFPFICRIHHLQAEVSSIHLPFRQAMEVHLPNLAGRGPFRSSNPSAIQAGCRPFRPKRGPIRPI